MFTLSPENKRLSGVICLSLVICCVVPLFGYSCYKLFQHWNEHYIIKRRRLVLLALCGLFGFAFIPANVGYCLIYIIYDREVQTFWIWCLTLDWFVTYSIFTIVLLRYYNLYFDFQYHRSLSNEEWVHNLNQLNKSSTNNRDTKRLQRNSILHSKQSWFVLNKSTYGNTQWLVKRAVVLCLLLTLLSITTDRVTLYLDPDGIHKLNIEYIYILVYMIMVVFGVKSIHSRIKKYSDTIHLKHEVFVMTLCVFFGVVILFSALILTFIFEIRETFMFVFCMQCIFFTAGTYVSTVYAIKINVKNERNDLIEYVKSELDATMHKINVKIKKYDGIKNDITIAGKREQIMWMDIVPYSDCYYEFMTFLQSEFSTENLLFISEVNIILPDILSFQMFCVLFFT